MSDAGKREGACCSWWMWVVLGLLLVVAALEVPQALTAFKQGKRDCAARAWTQRHLDMAAAAADQQELRKAERILEEAIKADPANPELRFSHLSYFVRRAAEQPQTIAEADLEPLEYAISAVEAGGTATDPCIAVARARLLLRNGKVDEAREVLDVAVAATPQYVYAFLALADLERAMGRPLEALAAFEKAAGAAPDNLVALNNLGVQYVELDRPEDAVKMFEKAIAVKDNAASRVNASDALQRLKRNEEALAHVQAAVTLSPGSAEMARRLGTMQLEMGMLDDAEKSLVGALDLKVETNTALVLGTVYLQKRAFDRSARLYAKLLEGNSDLLDAKFGWAESLKGLGKRAEASDAYQAYLAAAASSSAGEAARIEAARKALDSLAPVPE